MDLIKCITLALHDFFSTATHMRDFESLAQLAAALNIASWVYKNYRENIQEETKSIIYENNGKIKILLKNRNHHEGGIEFKEKEKLERAKKADKENEDLKKEFFNDIKKRKTRDKLVILSIIMCFMLSITWLLASAIIGSAASIPRWIAVAFILVLYIPIIYTFVLAHGESKDIYVRFRKRAGRIKARVTRMNNNDQNS